MDRFSKVSGIVCLSLALGACERADTPRDIREMKCYSSGQIIPEELYELEKSTRGKITTICGGKIVVGDFQVTSPWTQPVIFTTIYTTEGEIFSVKKDIQELLIPVSKAKAVKSETPEPKYRTKN